MKCRPVEISEGFRESSTSSTSSTDRCTVYPVAGLIGRTDPSSCNAVDMELIRQLRSELVMHVRWCGDGSRQSGVDCQSGRSPDKDAPTTPRPARNKIERTGIKFY